MGTRDTKIPVFYGLAYLKANFTVISLEKWEKSQAEEEEIAEEKPVNLETILFKVGLV